MAGGSRATIRSLHPEPRAATLRDHAGALGITALTSIDVADVVFFEAHLDAEERALIEAVLADPLLQTVDWDVPAEGLETALLPGVTDATAAAVRHAAATIGVEIGDAATGTHYAVSAVTSSEADTARLARRLLANEVVERWAAAPIEPAFVDATGAGAETAATVSITGLDAEGLAALNVDRGLALDPAELDAIVAHSRAAGREPTEVELEMLAQTWSEHCAHKTFRATITTDDGAVSHRCCASCATPPTRSPRRSCAARSSATPASSRSRPARRWRSRPRRTTTRRRSSRSAGRTPASAASSAT